MNNHPSKNLPWTIWPNPWRMARIALFCLLFVIAGVFLLVAPPLRPTMARQIAQPIVGVVSLIFGLIPLFLGFYKLFLRRKPVVTLDPAGIIFLDGTFIPWADFRAVEAYTITGNHNLTLSLQEESPFYPQRPFVELGFALATKDDFERAKGIIEEMISTTAVGHR